MATAKKSARKTATSKKAQPKGAAKKTAAKRSSAKKAAQKRSSTSKKESLMRQKRSTGEGPACWPGFERVPGKAAGTKGSCKPKPNQTPAERKEDARQAAGRKQRKAGSD